MGDRSNTRTTEVSAVILAAGRSERFGRSKALEPWNGRPLVRHMAELARAAATAEVIVVTGDRANEVAGSLQGTGARPIENPLFREGQSTTVRVGVEAARGDAVLVLPVDQPALTVEILNRLITAWRQRSRGIVVPEVAGKRYSPVVVGRSHFSDVARLRGDRGLRQLFDELESEIVRIDFDDEVPFSDVDTPDAWRWLAARVLAKPSGPSGS